MQATAAELGNPPIAYLLENTAFQYHWNSQIRVHEFATVCAILGAPVEVDAARFGSYAHRLRDFWTNVCTTQHMAAGIQQAERPAGLLVEHILEAGRTCAPVTKGDCLPWYACNKTDQPRAVLPTLVAYKGSYAFRPGQPGSIWDATTESFTEPTALERELALGYAAGDTAAPGVSGAKRCQVLGPCMDANTTNALFGIAEAWQELCPAQPSRISPGVLVAADPRNKPLID